MRYATNSSARLYAGGPATHIDRSLEYRLNFSYFDPWHSTRLGVSPWGWPYRPPFQTILEHRWGKVGIDPRKVNGAGPYSLQGTTKEPLHHVPIGTYFPEWSFLPPGPMDEDPIIHNITIPPTSQVRLPMGRSSPPLCPPSEHHDDNVANIYSVDRGTITTLPRNSLDMSPRPAPASGNIQPSGSCEEAYSSMVFGSRSGSSTCSDSDYTEMPAQTVKRAASADDVVEKPRGAGRSMQSATSKKTKAPHPYASPSSTTSHRYPCPHAGCPQVCERAHDLQRHLESKAHKNPSYECEWCSSVFTREDALKRHKGGRCAARNTQKKASSKAKVTKNRTSIVG